VVDCSTSASVWSTLELAFASPFNSRIMQLHGSLQDLQQGDDTVTLYLQCAKGLFDELVVADISISLTDFNLYVFRGLRDEFHDLITSLSTKVDPLSYSELHSHLSTHEFIHRSSVSSSLTTTPLLPTPAQPPSVYATQRGFSGPNNGGFMAHRGRGRRSGWRHPCSNFPQSNGQSFCGAGGGSPWQQPRSHSGQWQNHPHRGAATNQWPRQQIKCQLCHIYGHSAQQCSQLVHHGNHASANLSFSTTSAEDFAACFLTQMRITTLLRTLPV